jgi:glycosyltransferase involved in cell wall biosynthesis
MSESPEKTESSRMKTHSESSRVSSPIPPAMERPQALLSHLNAALSSASGEADGTLILSQLGPESLLAAAQSAPAAAHIYFAHRDARALQLAFQSLVRAAVSRPVLFFHGATKELVRDLPAHPALLAVSSAEDLFQYWLELPAGAHILLPAPLAEEAHWSAAGFLEPLSSGVYKTTGRFRADPSRLPAPLFSRVAFFGPQGNFREGAYSPQNRATGLVRRWWRDKAPKALSGYGDWPYAAAPTPLPDTLPNGERWPLISIVTPSFNQGKYIEETILSVASQGYPRIEHIVMDGGSKDETTAVMHRYRHFLAAAVSEKDKGQSNAINKGMALATGDILTWLNSDDMLAPGALAAVAMAFHTAAADLVAGVVSLRSNGKTVGHHLTSCDPGPLPLDGLLDLDNGWNAGKFFYQPEVMFSRDIWDRAGSKVREDLYYSMDYDLWVRIAEAGGRLHVIGHPVAWFRLHDEQKTSAEAKFKAELLGYVDAYYARTNRPKPAPKPPPARASLRIAMLNDHGFQYGAGIAHRRMAEAFAFAGHDVSALSLRFDPGDGASPSELTAEEVATAVASHSPDLVVAGNLHSAGADPWQLGLVAERYPTLSVLHDFWLLTGRCPYPTPCTKYISGCDASCPTANQYPVLPPDKIAPAWNRKQKLLFGNNQLMLLGNSQWTCSFAIDAMAAAGQGRPPRPVQQFRLSFPLETFRAKDRQTCRALLGLPIDRFIVLLSGDLYDPRKNTRLALDALASLQLPDLTIVSLGQKRDGEHFQFSDIRRLGHIYDPDHLASLYAAADIYVAPSREETFGQVFIESIACGTPVIGVRASGMQEAVVEGLTGLLAEEFSTEALAAAIFELYRKPDLRVRMGQWGRIYVQNEWSVMASYYHLFRAWRSLGLLQKLGLPEKIGFRPAPPELSQVRIIRRGEGMTIDPVSLGPEEGPYPEYSLPRFRWAYGPVSEMHVHSTQAGSHSLVLRYRNLHPDQTMSLALNGQPLGAFPLPATGIEKGRLVCIKAELREGGNTLKMEFSRWADAAKEGRPMAAAITEIRFLPDEASA